MVPNMGIILTQWCQGPRQFQPVEMTVEMVGSENIQSVSSVEKCLPNAKRGKTFKRCAKCTTSEEKS